MRRSLVRFALLGSLFVFGCAKPTTTTETTGTGNSSGSGNGGSGQTSGSGGSQTSGNGGSDSGTGGNSSGSTGGSTGTSLHGASERARELGGLELRPSDPIAIQGAIYGYSDGSSCPTRSRPTSARPAAAASAAPRWSTRPSPSGAAGSAWS